MPGRIGPIAWLLLAAAAAVADAATKAQEKTLADAKKALKAGRTMDAAAGFRAFAHGAPADDRAPWALIQVGDLEQRAGRESVAIEAYQEVVRRWPASPDANVARAKLSALSGSVLGAARARLEGAKTEAERTEALWALGEVYERGGEHANAAVAYRDVRASTRAFAWKQKAAAKLDAMVEARIAALGAATSDPARLREIADMSEAASQWDRAADYHQRAGAAGRDPAAVLRGKVNAARSLTLGRQWRRAHALYEEVRAGNPPAEIAEEATRAEGLLHEDHREYGEAVATYDAWLAGAGAGEETLWARRRRAWCLERAGRTDTALAAYQEMATRWPKHVAAAESLLAIGRIAEARREFDQARQSYTRCADEFTGTRNGDEARARLLGLPRRIAEWERAKAEIARMAEAYARRERRGE